MVVVLRVQIKNARPSVLVCSSHREGLRTHSTFWKYTIIKGHSKSWITNSKGMKTKKWLSGAWSAWSWKLPTSKNCGNRQMGFSNNGLAQHET
jgi:hypothetical protein